MLLGFDATTIRGNKSGVGYYTSRLLSYLTTERGPDNPIDELLVLSNRAIGSFDVPRCRVISDGRFPLRAVWMQTVLPRILQRERPDLCHFTNFLAPYRTDVPYVVTLHDMTLELLPHCHTWRKRMLTRYLTPSIGRNARLVLTPSESAKRDVVRLFGLDDGRVRAIPHAADPQFHPRRDTDSLRRIESRYGVREPYVLYVGTLEPRKNLTRAVAAFSRIAHRFPDHRFYLAGELGWKPRELLETLASVPHRERIVRLGYVAEEDLAALYSNADLFVYPSLYEGFGFPVVEAMACGTPVLTSSTSSLAEIAEGAAMLCEPTDVQMLAESMERALESPDTRRELRTAGLHRARSFSWERTTRETLAAYEEALERSVVRPRMHRLTPPEPGHGAKAIHDTLVYGALFDFPMTLEEIHRSLHGERLSRQTIAALLATDPFLRAHVETKPPYYFLKGREETLTSRHAARVRTRRLLEREDKFLRLVRRCPFVRMVAFSGATAHENTRDDDIDLFIVTAPGRTWAVAFVLFALMKLVGRRRTLCLNYFIGEDRLSLGERDPFTASQIVSLRPLAGRGVLYRLIRANTWGAAFFPNFWAEYRSLTVSDDTLPVGSFTLETALSSWGGRLLERLGRALLGAYLRRRARGQSHASVKLEPGVIKLHFNDHGSDLARELEVLHRAPSPPETPRVSSF